MTDAGSTLPPAPAVLRKFGVVLAVALVVLFFLLLPWLFERSRPAWVLWVAGPLLVAALVVPRILAPVYRGWMVGGRALGIVNSKIVLGALFFLVIVPMGAFMRAIGRNPVKGRRDGNAATYRVDTGRAHDAKSMERPF